MITAKERPILFNAPMVRAILAGQKTQTRRAVKDLLPWQITEIVQATGGRDLWMPNGPAPSGRGTAAGPWRACPYGRPGDRLWVRESFWIEHDSDSHEGSGAFDCGIDLKTGDWASVCYCADQDTAGTWIGPDQFYPERTFVPWGEGGLVPEFFSKRPNIHMPRWACRILLEITGVRVERLQSIREEDARAEGVTIEEHHKMGYCAGEFLPPSIRAFRDLWTDINDAGSWESNPWVWVVEFRRTTKWPAT